MWVFFPTLSGTRNTDVIVLLNLAYWAYRALPDEDDDDPYECCRRWTNLNAFLARRFLYYQEPFLLLMIGISTVKTALEQEPPTQDKEDAGRASTFEVHNTRYPNMLPYTLAHIAYEILNECNNPTDCTS